MSLIVSGSAYADRLAPTASAARAPVPLSQSPYRVDIIGENGSPLKVHAHRGRFYVLGTANQRYTIRVNNPTSRRIEAVLSVDGLDVIDGKTADVRKRGYVVPAWGELRVDGFRTSTEHVATFRFSSVSSSYAGRKGQARNVGVIGVAIFEEQAPPQVIMPRPYRHPRSSSAPRDYDYHAEAEAGQSAPAPGARPQPPTRSESRSSADKSGSAGSAAPSASSRRSLGGAPVPHLDEAYESYRPRERPGLGTEFGERRHSAVSWTRFERAHATRPTAIAELRYNDVRGLRALGIRIRPVVTSDEIGLRETANPFPGSPFAQPPTR